MKELCTAMAEAFPEIMNAVMDKENPHYKSKYASLNNVIDAVKPALAKRGLWFIQTIHNIPGYAAVETIIMHSSGQYLTSGILAIPVVKQDSQGYGSAMTYARRYSLASAFGVAPGDGEDDGEESCKKPEGKGKEYYPSKNQQVPKVATSEVPKLNDGQLLDLAYESVEIFTKDGLSPALLPEEFVEYLEHWRDKSNVQADRIKSMLTNNSKKLFDSYFSWRSKQ
jgi:hypothetical protein